MPRNRTAVRTVMVLGAGFLHPLHPLAPPPLSHLSARCVRGFERSWRGEHPTCCPSENPGHKKAGGCQQTEGTPETTSHRSGASWLRFEFHLETRCWRIWTKFLTRSRLQPPHAETGLLNSRHVKHCPFPSLRPISPSFSYSAYF